MVGRNAAKLTLPAEFKRLHPVFNLSLLSRYVSPVDVTRPPDRPILTGLAEDLNRVCGVTHVMGFRKSSSGADEYLLRFGMAPGLDDSWVPLADIAPSIFPSLLDFHRLYPSLLSGVPSMLGPA